DMSLTGLDCPFFNYEQLEFYGHLNFLKAGIVFADRISTVSPTYAREIQTPYYGCGLQGVLAGRSRRLAGIVNGVDYSAWDPSHDPHLAATYDADSVQRGKALCKAALQKALGLGARPAAPLLGMVARLVEQKGVDLFLQAAPRLLQQSAQLLVLGEGDPVYHQLLMELRERHPQQVGVMLGFDESLAHQIEGGADLFLMPSLYEPSGLNQLYSLRYGAVPVVRATGGLADTVVDTNPGTLTNRTATGFSFGMPAPEPFWAAIQRALVLYWGEPTTWRQVMRTAMLADWSWHRSAADYEGLYLKARGER